MTCDVCQKPKDNFSGFWQGWEEGGLGQLLDLWRCWEGKGMGLSVWGLRLLPIAALHAHLFDGHKPPVAAANTLRHAGAGGACHMSHYYDTCHIIVSHVT